MPGGCACFLVLLFSNYPVGWAAPRTRWPADVTSRRRGWMRISVWCRRARSAMARRVPWSSRATGLAMFVVSVRELRKREPQRRRPICGLWVLPTRTPGPNWSGAGGQEREGSRARWVLTGSRRRRRGAGTGEASVSGEYLCCGGLAGETAPTRRRCARGWWSAPGLAGMTGSWPRRDVWEQRAGAMAWRLGLLLLNNQAFRALCQRRLRALAPAESRIARRGMEASVAPFEKAADPMATAMAMADASGRQRGTRAVAGRRCCCCEWRSVHRHAKAGTDELHSAGSSASAERISPTESPALLLARLLVLCSAQLSPLMRIWIARPRPRGDCWRRRRLRA